jgi:Domain of unknown function (DUF4349)
MRSSVLRLLKREDFMRITQVFVVLISLFFVGCAQSAANSASYSSANANRAVSSAPREAKGGGGGGTRETAQVSLDDAEQSKPVPTATERKIIRNADLTLEASSPEELQQKVTAIAESKGGFVIESQQSSSSSQVTTRDVVTMTVRVPAEKFNESLDEIRKNSSRVVVETVKGQDVTEEFVDIEARLKTKKALEEQFLEIMKQSKTVADTLNVQKELAEVRGEIEQIEGRKRFLENQSSLSTITLRLQTPAAFSGSSNGFFYQLKESLSDGFSGALMFILFLVRAIIALLPFLILIVLPIYLVIRYFLKKSRKQKAADEIVREEIRNE